MSVAWTALLDKGNFRHNISVLKSNKGVLVIKYLKKDKVYSETECIYIYIYIYIYIPCEFCLALYSKTELWDHQKRCKCQKLREIRAPGARGESPCWWHHIVAGSHTCYKMKSYGSCSCQRSRSPAVQQGTRHLLLCKNIAINSCINRLLQRIELTST